MRKSVLAALSLALLPTAALAQNTSCYTTGYGSMQHLWCNTTPAAPAPDYSGTQQGYDNFSNGMANLGAAIRERRAAKKAAAERQANLLAIADFAASPDHPRFEELRPYMADMIRAGRASNLQDAYTLAVAEHPTPAK